MNYSRNCYFSLNGLIISGLIPLQLQLNILTWIFIKGDCAKKKKSILISHIKGDYAKLPIISKSITPSIPFELTLFDSKSSQFLDGYFEEGLALIWHYGVQSTNCKYTVEKKNLTANQIK